MLQNNDASIIDHVYTACLDRISEVLESTITISDHLPLCITRRLNGTDLFKISSNINTSNTDVLIISVQSHLIVIFAYYVLY